VGAPVMLSKEDREEVRQLIEDAMRRELREAIRESLDAWMHQYHLGPEHWVFIEAQYQKALAQSTLIRRIMLTVVVTTVCGFTLWAGEEWVKQKIVQSLHSHEVQTDGIPDVRKH